MREEVETLARYRLERARKTFKEAVLLFENKAFEGAINRFYYACFYAARALLAIREVDSSKHSGVIKLFNQYFVKTGLMEMDIWKIFPKSFEDRLDSDYKDKVSFDYAHIQHIKQKTALFIEKCEEILNKLIEARGIRQDK